MPEFSKREGAIWVDWVVASKLGVEVYGTAIPTLLIF